MKQGQVLNAIGIINVLRGYNYASSEAYDLFRLRKTLLPVAEFQHEERQKLAEKYPYDEIDGGRLKFRNPDDAEKYVEEINALGNMDVDIAFKPITLTLRDDIRMYPDDFMVLDGIIDFRKEEEPEIQVSTAPADEAKGEETK